MPRKRKLTDLGSRCRFCLARDACMAELFTDRLRAKLQDVEKCSDIEILDKPNYPRNICYVCLYKIEMWTEFKTQFLKTNSTLISHFKIFENTESDSVINKNNSADDTIVPDETKRIKFDDEERPQSSDKLLSSANESTPMSPKKLVVTLESIDGLITDIKDEEIKSKSTLVKDNDLASSKNKNPRGRPKKIERQAFTKRWVERKNALLAATGEIPSESDSENDSKGSPVQKAQEEIKQKRLQGALKKLETNMNEKYCVNPEEVLHDGERKTRSRRGNAENKLNVPIRKSKTFKSLKSEEEGKVHLNIMEQKKTAELKIITIVKDKKAEEIQKISDVDMEEKANKDEEKDEIQRNHIKENEVEEQQKTEKADAKEKEEKSFQRDQKIIQEENSEKEKNVVEETVTIVQKADIMKDTLIENNNESDIDVVDVQEEKKNNHVAEKLDETTIASKCIEKSEDNVLKNTISDEKKIDSSTYLPQLVTSEITIGNATYIVTTTLDMPNLSPSKTNGMNVDTSSQDGKKIDIMNAVQLQRINSKDGALSKRNLESEIQKCLKIEIEGMEVEALQRVQLDLAHFVNDEIKKRLVDNPEVSKPEPKPVKFKDSYENLNHQLRDIIEKVLRNNCTADKLSSLIVSNQNNIPSDAVKSAEKSPALQPKVMIDKFDIKNVCEKYTINNIHILEEVKREVGLVGPRSRTLGKRKPVLPKKFEDFSVCLRPDEDDDRKKKQLSSANKSTSLNIGPASVQSTTVKSKPTERESSSPSVMPVIRPILPKQVESSVATTIPVTNDLQIAPKIQPTIKEPQLVTEPVLIMTMLPMIRPVGSASTAITPAATPPAILPAVTPSANQAAKVTVPKKSTQVDSMEVPSLPSLAPITMLPTIPSSPMTPSGPPGPAPPPKSNNSSEPIPIAPMPTPPKRERHICGMCSKELFSTQEANNHMEWHKTEMAKNSLSNVNATPTSVSNSAATTPKPKPKLMRCKRCQAIVEATQVKTHVCNSVKYNCNQCECSFGAEYLLKEHLDTTHSKNRNKVATTPTVTPKTSVAKEKQRTIITRESNERKKLLQNSETELEGNLEKVTTNKDSQQSYSCFVCDKTFIDEQQMKDHLQMHCEEVSEDISDKNGFQCAFCGEKFQTEESLETHVGNHLMEDGDEKINMMLNLETRRERPRKTIFRCEQCSDTFFSSYELALHLPIHEEEEAAALAEIEKQEAEAAAAELARQEVEAAAAAVAAAAEQHVCSICDEIFDTGDELSQHLDVHNGSTHVCILCEKPFTSIRELQEHVSTHL